MDTKKLYDYINQEYDNTIIPTLCQYIKIPNKSPHFDQNWREHGYMDQAVKLISTWCENNAIDGMQLEILQIEDKTPLIFIDIKGDSDGTFIWTS